MSLDYNIISEIKSFMQYKNAQNGVPFNVWVESIAPSGECFQWRGSVIISEIISSGDFEITFMDDVKPFIGGYLMMRFSYMKRVVFCENELNVETSESFVLSLK